MTYQLVSQSSSESFGVPIIGSFSFVRIRRIRDCGSKFKTRLKFKDAELWMDSFRFEESDVFPQLASSVAQLLVQVDTQSVQSINYNSLFSGALSSCRDELQVHHFSRRGKNQCCARMCKE